MTLPQDRTRMWYTEETSMELRIDKKCVMSECRTKTIYNMSLSMCVHVLFIKLTEINNFCSLQISTAKCQGGLLGTLWGCI